MLLISKIKYGIYYFESFLNDTMSRTLNVLDLNCIPLMTKIERSIRSGVVTIIKLTNYRLDFGEVEKAVENICRRLNLVALVFPIYCKRKVVSVHLIPI